MSPLSADSSAAPSCDVLGVGGLCDVLGAGGAALVLAVVVTVADVVMVTVTLTVCVVDDTVTVEGGAVAVVEVCLGVALPAAAAPSLIAALAAVGAEDPGNVFGVSGSGEAADSRHCSKKA